MNAPEWLQNFIDGGHTWILLTFPLSLKKEKVSNIVPSIFENSDLIKQQDEVTSETLYNSTDNNNSKSPYQISIIDNTAVEIAEYLRNSCNSEDAVACDDDDVEKHRQFVEGMKGGWVRQGKIPVILATWGISARDVNTISSEIGVPVSIYLSIYNDMKRLDYYNVRTLMPQEMEDIHDKHPEWHHAIGNFNFTEEFHMRVMTGRGCGLENVNFQDIGDDELQIHSPKLYQLIQRIAESPNSKHIIVSGLTQHYGTDLIYKILQHRIGDITSNGKKYLYRIDCMTKMENWNDEMKMFTESTSGILITTIENPGVYIHGVSDIHVYDNYDIFTIFNWVDATYPDSPDGIAVRIYSTTKQGNGTSYEVQQSKDIIKELTHINDEFNNLVASSGKIKISSTNKGYIII